MKTTRSFEGFLDGHPVVREQDEWEYTGVVHKDDTLSVYEYDHVSTFRTVKKAEQMIAILQRYISTYSGDNGDEEDQ